MTAIVDTAPGVPLTRRWANVVRIHVANPWPTLVTPWLIYLAVFGLMYAVWRTILMVAGDGGVDRGVLQYNGGATWILIYMVVVAAQSMNETFRFAMGFSSTRRDYFVGTVVLFAGLSAMYAVGITVLAGVESLTGGWGVGGGFFAPAFLANLPLVQVAYVYFAALLLMFSVGASVGSVYVRWGSSGILAFWGVVAAALVGASWWISSAGAWGSVGAFFTDNSVTTLMTWSLLVSLGAVLVGYTLMRRATARS